MMNLAGYGSGYWHEFLAEPGLRKKHLARVTYETVELWVGDGECAPSTDCGFFEYSKTVKTGRSSSTTVTDATT